MDIVIGSSHKPTSICTEERSVVVAPDVGDKIVVVLGINRVTIEHVDGSWTLSHGSNVVSKHLSQKDPNAFIPLNVDLKELNS